MTTRQTINFLIKKNGGAGKPHSKERSQEGANFAQIVQAELKKALHKNMHKFKKCCKYASESDNDLDDSS